MQRNEKLFLIRDVPAAIIDALDGVMATQGLARTVLRELEEDFTPLLTAAGDPIVFVLSQPKDDWTACFSSLGPEAEWELAEMLAVALEQPLAYLLISDMTNMSAYRYFADGILHAEYMPGDPNVAELDAQAVLDRLQQQHIALDLIDDRTQNFGDQHIVAGYSANPAAHDAGQSA